MSVTDYFQEVISLNMYELAKQRYAEIGVDTEKAIEKLFSIPLSIHCWQGDDVTGFENSDEALSGGIAATGNYPGRAATPVQLRDDIKKVLSLVGGKHRLSLHANYAETNGKKVDRNELRPEHFENWVEFAKSEGIALDFNPTIFAHPKMDGFSLSSLDDSIRNFWIEHCIAMREIADSAGRELGSKAVTNVWIPDGFKDIPADRYIYRKKLSDSLDKIFEKDTPYCLDSVESKVFGMGVESYTVGSHEFYMGYAVKNQKLITLDTGHFHPTEYVSDKITGVIDFVPGILLHTSRPVRWDSDHVVILDDELIRIMSEISRHNLFNKVYIGLDFFDASINRIAAWIIGIRNTQKAILLGLLEPSKTLFAAEEAGDYTSRLVLMEEYKTMPFGAVWDEFLTRAGLQIGAAWLDEVKQYEKDVLSKR